MATRTQTARTKMATLWEMIVTMTTQIDSPATPRSATRTTSTKIATRPPLAISMRMVMARFRTNVATVTTAGTTATTAT